MKNKKHSILDTHLFELRNVAREISRPYLLLTDFVLIDEIDSQKEVVMDCIRFAKKVAEDENPFSIEPLEGLYFAFHRYQELTTELTERIIEKFKQEQNE